jgi:hypothetical protein
MKVEGQCHCGAVAWEAEVDPGAIGLCHCADCQSLSGSPYRASVAAKDGTFKVTRGAPKTYVKTADSGKRRAQTFCGDCGSPIYAADAENPTAYTLRIGGLKQRHEFTPKRRIWAKSALPWSQDLTGLPASPAEPER